MRDRLLRWLPALIFGLALALRLSGIGWGLKNDLHNQSYHPDEQVIWQVSQGVKPAKLDFTPGFYNYGTLYLTCLRVASDMVAAYTGGNDPAKLDSYWAYLSRCHLAGRFISAVAGAGLALLMYFLIQRFTGRFGATVGALSMAFAPGLVVHSRFQTVDMLATLLFAASLFCALKLLAEEASAWSKPDLRNAAWAGLFAGLSAGTKYTGIIALLGVVVACILAHRGNPLKAIALAVLTSVLGLVVGTPGILLESGKFMQDFGYELGHTSTGHGLVFEGVGNGFVYQFSNLGVAFGPAALILSIMGLIWAALSRERWLAVLGSACLAYFLVIGRAEVLFLRYVFPVCVLSAAGIGYVAGTAHKKKGGWLAVGGFSLLAVGLSLGAAWQWTSVMFVDARDVMARYLKQNSKPETSVGLVSDPWFYTPPLIPDSAIVRGAFAYQMEEMAAASAPKVLRYVPENPDERIDWDVRLLDQKPDYVVFSSFEAGDLARLSARADLKPDVQLQVGRFKAFLDRLQREYDEQTGSGNPIARYAARGPLVHDMQYVRPSLFLWKRKTP